jgi:SAM-dependent methyltransferase
MAHDPSRVRAAYDEMAEEYARRIAGELAEKPFDREVLDRFAASLPAGAHVGDVGCGPGHVSRYLQDRGLRMTGIDLSPMTIEVARRLQPDLDLRVGDMTALDIPDASWAGAVALYSLIHLSRGDLPRALAELHRVIAPGGRLLVSFHVGRETKHFDEWWGHPIDLDFHYFEAAEMVEWLDDAGFEELEVRERGPYPEHEAQTRRCYILGVRGEAAG